jgi:hypothetical protein
MKQRLRDHAHLLLLFAGFAAVGYGGFRWGVQVGTVRARQAASAPGETTRYEVTPGGPRRGQSQLWFDVEDGQTKEGSFCRGRVVYRQSGLPAHVLIVGRDKKTGALLGQTETDPATGEFELTTPEKVTEWELAALKPGSRLAPRRPPQEAPTT